MPIFSLFLCNAQENLSVSDAVKLTLENNLDIKITENQNEICLLYTSPSPRDGLLSRMPSSA